MFESSKYVGTRLKVKALRLLEIRASMVGIMYLRTTRRKNKNGTATEYYQLAHNERHPETGKTVAKIIHSFGRADQLNRDALARLCRSIARVCGLSVIDPEAEGNEGLRQFGRSKEGTWTPK